MAASDTTSYWQASASLPKFPALASDLNVHVCVIGAGITGITAAALLKRAGVSVALIDRGRCGGVDTSHTTAHVTHVYDIGLAELQQSFGPEVARAVWHAGIAAIDQIDTNIRTGGIECDFRWVPGYLHVPFKAGEEISQHVKTIADEGRIARELGFRVEALERVPCFETAGLRFPRQALFHPLKYLAGLLAQLPGDGCEIFEQSAATEIETEPLAVRVGEHRIRCRHVIVATHNPVTGLGGGLRANLLQTKLSLYQTYAIGARLPLGTIPEAVYWDTADPYNYLRVEHRGSYDYAIYGGEDHKTGHETDTAASFARLERRFHAFAPQVTIDHRWSGQFIESNDGLPFIGQFDEHVFVSTAYSGNGMTMGTLGGMMAADAVLHRKNPWQELFDPHRKKVFGGAWDFIKENAEYPFYLLRDWIGGAEGDSLAELDRSQGKILKIDGKKVAAHRDENGKVTLCSAVCTHMQCIVAWNNAEQTWDCPCHGSRFKPTGEVISGPADEPLERIDSTA